MPKRLRLLNMILLLEVFKKKTVKTLFLSIFSLVLSSSVGAAEKAYVHGKTKVQPQASRTTEAAITGTYKKLKNNPVDGYGITFKVTNNIGRKVYVVPFAYIKRFLTDPWHWYKAPILELDVNQFAFADIGTVPSVDDLTTVFGCLRMCDTKEEAEAATYQLSTDDKKIDLDLLSVLNRKEVILHSFQYGVQGERLSYEVVPSHWQKVLPPLDFHVVNATPNPVYVAAFFYGKEQDADEFVPWRFTKTDAYLLEPGKDTLIKVQAIKDPYDWSNVTGFLGVFKENEAKRAKNSTYELLQAREKIVLGPLASLGNKQVVLGSTQYGSDSLFNITTAPASVLAR